VSLAAKFNALVEEQDQAELRGAVKAFRPLVGELEGVAASEVKAWFASALSSAEDGDVGLSDLAYQDRRRAMRALTDEARQEAERVEARTRLLGSLLSTAGDVGLVALRLLVKGLVGGL